jgi:putative lipoic acid-binding regulatory protein
MNEENETLLEFPCEFSVKAMGLSSHPDFVGLILEIVSLQVPGLTTDNCRTKQSKNGKYLSVSVTFQATSKAQLDSIYYALTDHNDVVMSL